MEAVSVKHTVNFTVIENIQAIANNLNRTPEEISRFISKKLGTSLSKKGFNGHFTKDQIQLLINEFVKTNVLCKHCGNPETVISKSKRTCKACGKES